MSQASSYDRPSISSVSFRNCPASGSCILHIYGSGFSTVDFTPMLRAGRTACSSTPWKSESSVKCRVPMGTGRNAGIFATMSSLVGSLTEALSYDAPVIFSSSMHLWSPSGATVRTRSLTLNSTVGNVSVAFYGRNFGVFAQDWVVTYGHPPDFDSYICDVHTSVSNESYVVCKVSQGVGVRHRFRIVVDGQIASGVDRLNYPSPILQSSSIRFEGSVLPFAQSLIGNSTENDSNLIEISGMNFGPYFKDVEVTYGPMPSALKYRCSVKSATHTSIVCATDAGIGRGHVFNITIGRQSVLSTFVFHYPPPELESGSVSNVGRSLSASYAVGSTTLGGIDIIEIKGRNFGPAAKDTIVHYSQDFSSLNHVCTVVEGFHQTKIRCVTASGTGKGHTFTVKIGTQIVNSSDTFHYPAPIFKTGSLRILGQTCAGPTKCLGMKKDGQGRVRAIARSTIGSMNIIEIDGSNFGPDAHAVKMTYGSCPDPCSVSQYIPKYDCTVIVSPGVSNNHTRVQCSLVNGMGVGYAFALTVNGQTAVSADRITYPDPLTYSGTIRVMSNVTSVPSEYFVMASNPGFAVGLSTVGGDLIQIQGRNFGPLANDVSIFYGPPRNRFKYSCAVVHIPGQWNHTTAHCIVAPGAGADNVFIIQSGPTLSVISQDIYRYPKPSLTGTTLRYSDSAPKVINASGIESSALFSIVNATNSFGNQVLHMQGENFGPNPSDVVVTYSRPFSPYTFLARIIENHTNHTSVMINTSSGFGQSLFMRVSVGGQYATGIDMFSYPRPEFGAEVSRLARANSTSGTTSAIQSLIFSESLSLATAGVAQLFMVRARDSLKKDLGFGGDWFEVRAVDAFTRLPNTTIVDNFDGTYSCYVHATIAGLYTVSIRLQPLLTNLHNSPFKMRVLASGVVEPRECTTLGIDNTIQTAGRTATFQLDARDRFGNQLVDGADLFFADAISEFAQNVTSFIGLPSIVEGQRLQSGSILITRSSVYHLRLIYNGTGSKANPYVFEVVPNDAVASSSLLLGSRSMTTSTDFFMTYQVQLRDAYANLRTIGGFKLVAAISSGPISDTTALQLDDNKNGSFIVTNRLTRSGSYSIVFGLETFDNPLPFSPVSVIVVPGAPTATVSRAYGTSLRNGVAGNLEIFGLSIFDKYANPATLAGLNLEIALFRDEETFVAVPGGAAITYSNGTYSGQYSQTYSGQYVITLLVVGEPIFASPFSLFIDAAEVTTADSAAFQSRSEFLSLDLPSKGVDAVLGWLNESSGMIGGVQGLKFDIIVRARDRFGNAANRAGIVFDVSTEPSYAVSVPVNMGQGNLLTSFTPTSQHAGLKINVKYKGAHIRSSPFTVDIASGVGATSGAQCFALGDATSVGTAGVDGVFILQAADSTHRYRTSGGDSFSISMAMGSISGILNISDRSSGVYVVTSFATVSGMYTLTVALSGSQSQGSPYSVHIIPAETSPTHCTVHGLAVGTAGVTSKFEIRARDRFSNVQIYNQVQHGNLFKVKMAGRAQFVPSITDLKNSSYIVTFTITISGTYSVAIGTRLNTDLVGGSESSLVILSNQVDPRFSLVYGAGAESAVAGVDAAITAKLRDVYENIANGALSTLRAVANGTSLTLTGITMPDGTLSVTYSLTRSGVYHISVQAFDSNSSLMHVGGSPFTVTISPAAAFPGSSIIILPIISKSRVGRAFSFLVDTYDRYGNSITAGSSTVSAYVTLTSLKMAEIVDLRNGSYMCTFQNLGVGTYNLVVQMQGVSIGNSSQCVDADSAACASRDTCDELKLVMFAPASSCCKCGGGTWRPPDRYVDIIPGPMDIKTSYIASRTNLTCKAGQNVAIRIVRRDQYFNPTFYNDSSVSASFDGVSDLIAAGAQLVPVLREDGTEIVISWRVTRAGSYQLFVTLATVEPGNTLHVAESPYVVEVRSETLKPLLSMFSGSALSVSTAGISSTFLLTTRDVYGNKVRIYPSEPSPPFVFEISSGGDKVLGDIMGTLNNSLIVSYYITASATYRIDAYYRNATGRLKVFSYTPLPIRTNAIEISSIFVQPLPVSVIAGTVVQLKFTVKDAYFNDITSGGASFSITQMVLGSETKFSMTDWNNGTYSFSPPFTVAGDHYLKILLGQQRVTKDSLHVLVLPQAVPNANKSFAQGPGTVGGIVGINHQFGIYFRDAYENAVPATTSVLLVLQVTYLAGGTITPSIDSSSAQYKSASYTSTKSGEAILAITVGGESLAGSPFSLKFGTRDELRNTVGYGILAASRSFVRGLTPDLSMITAGSTATLAIQAVDQLGFEMETGGASCEVKSVRSGTLQERTFACTDTNAGSYAAALTGMTVVGKYTFAIKLGGNAIAGKPPNLLNPFEIQIVAGDVSALNSKVLNRAFGTAGEVDSFIIEARDAFTNLNASAGRVLISLQGPSSEANLQIEDRLNGTFGVRYRVTASGSYTISCNVGSVDIKSSDLTVVPNIVSSVTTVAEGSGLSSALAGDQAEFRLIVRDFFGNSQRSDGVTVRKYHTSKAINTTTTRSVRTVAAIGEQVIFSYLSTVAGDYRLDVTVYGVPLAQSPWTVHVNAGLSSAVDCLVQGKGTKEATAGELATFAIQARDRYSNHLSKGGFTFFLLVQDQGSMRRRICVDKTNGLYDCSYLTTIAGKVTLSITSSSVHVLGSPFTVPVKSNSFNATTTLVYGLGSSMEIATAGRSNVLLMASRDFLGNFLDTGFENFVVAIGPTDTDKKLPSCLNMPTGTLVCTDVMDYKNGSYSIRYLATRSAYYTINIYYYTAGVPTRVGGSTFNLTVVAADVSASTSKVTFPDGYPCVGSSGTCGRVTEKFRMVVNLQDIYGNLQLRPTSVLVVVQHEGASSTLYEGTVTNGLVPLTFFGTHSGAYKVSVSVKSEPMDDIALQLSPLLFSENGFFAAHGSGLSIATAGQYAQFIISTRDFFGNKVTTQLFPTFNIRSRNNLEEEVNIKTSIVTQVFGSEWNVRMQTNVSVVMQVELIVMSLYVAGMPFRVEVKPGILSIPASTAEGPGIRVGVHTRQTWYYIRPNDQFGNVIQSGSLSAIAFHSIILHGDGREQYLDQPSFGSDGWITRYSPFSVGFPTYRLTVTINSVGISGSPFTVQIRSSGSEFPSASECFATGVATKLSTAGVDSSFTVQAADSYGVYQTAGNAQFSAEMVFEDKFLRLQTTDNNDGTYTMQYRITLAGRYTMAISYGSAHISGSPFTVNILPAETSAKYSRFDGEGLSGVIAGQEGSFTIEARDRFGNIQKYRPQAALPFGVNISGPVNKLALLKDFKDSSFVVVYNLTVSGRYTIHITAGNSEPAEQILVVRHSSYWAGTSYIEQAMLTATAGLQFAMKFAIRDLWSNVAVPPKSDSEVTSIACTIATIGPTPIVSQGENFVTTINMTVSGQYQIDLVVMSSPTSTSPYTLQIVAAELSFDATTVTGPGLTENTADIPSLLTLTPRDAHGNIVDIVTREVLVALVQNATWQFSIEKQASVFAINYTASFPCPACNLTIQVRGAHVKGSPFAMVINPAAAPELKSAVFMSHLAGLTVLFDRPTDQGVNKTNPRSGPFDCVEILAPSSYAVTGANSQCAWTSLQSLTVLFGSGTTIGPNALISVKESTVMTSRRNSRFASGGVAVLVPDNAMKPEPTVNSPGRIAPCDPLVLDASLTHGDGGRDMEFQWGLELGPRNRADVMQLLTAAGRTQRIVTIRSGLLLQDTKYTFTLSVVNFIEQQKAIQSEVYVASTDTPQVFIVGSSRFSSSGPKPLRLRGKAALSSCAKAVDNQIGFEWMQIGGPEIAQWPAESSLTASSLYLPGNTLTGGNTYTMRLSAVLKNNANGFSYADVSVEIVSSPVLAILDGGDRTHSASLALTLDASKSVDPDNSLQPFSYVWACSPDPCFNDVSGLLVRNDAVLSIPANTLAPGTYVFSITVMKDPGPRSSQASLQISILPGAVSSVSISVNDARGQKVSAVERLVLTGQVKSALLSRSTPCTPTYAWSNVDGRLDLEDPSKISTDLVSPNLVIKGGSLIRGQSYVIELTASCDLEMAGRSRISVQADQGPVPGSFTPSPLEGTAFKTTFTLECSQWTEELDNMPLLYQYQAALWDRVKPLSGQITSNRLDILLSPPTKPGENNETISLSATVCNSFGSCTASAVTQVLLKADTAKADPSALFTLVSSAQGVGNAEMVVGASSAIFEQLNVESRRRRRQDLPDRRKEVDVRNSLMAALTQLLGTVVTPDSVTFMTTALQPSMNTDLPFQDMHQQGLEITKRLLQTSIKVQRVSDTASQNLGETLSAVVKAVSLQSPMRRSAGGSNKNDDVDSLMTTLGYARLIGRVPYEAALMIQTENLEQTISRFSDKQLHGRPLMKSTKCLAGVCNAVLLPQASPQSIAVVDAQLLVWGSDKRSDEKELFVTNVTSVQLLDGATVLSGTLAGPLQISIPVRPSAASAKQQGEYVMPVCQYWDELTKTWKSKGCIAVGNRSDSLECVCFHTTDFIGIFRAGLFDLGRSDLFMTKDDVLKGREPHRLFVILSVALTSFMATMLVVYAYRYDIAVSKSYAPKLRSSLFQRGYLHAASRRLQQRFRSLFVDLWARRTVHLMVTRHGILGIFYRHSKDPYDRASRIACLSIHVVACMSLNIIWLGAVGVPDAQMLEVGIFTGLILIPIVPLCASIFRAVAPAARDRRKKNKKEGQKSEEGKTPRITEAFRTPPSVRRTRRSRIEVVGTVEAVDNATPGPGEGGEPAPRTPPRPSASIPPSRRFADASQLQDVVPPRAWQRTGPRTPEELGARRPRASGSTLQTAGQLVQRPADLPPVRSAFAETGSERDDTALVGLEIPGRKVHKSVRAHKSPAHRALPRPFIFMAYCSAFVMNSMAVVLSVVYGSSFQAQTSVSWALACVTSLVVEYVLVEPLWILATAGIQVRTHLKRTVEEELGRTNKLLGKVHPASEEDAGAHPSMDDSAEGILLNVMRPGIRAG
jgi:hypothetical protein